MLLVVFNVILLRLIPASVNNFFEGLFISITFCNDYTFNHDFSLCLVS